MEYKLITIDVVNLECKDTPLREVSKPINISEHKIIISKLIDGMIQTIKSIDHALGISAIQLGYPYRIFIVNMSKLDNKYVIAINPEVLSISGRFEQRIEGCLSLPNYKAKVIRRNKVTFKAYDLDGNEFTYSAKGYEAAVVQHEFDHLNGILYWDRLEEGEILLPI